MELQNAFTLPLSRHHAWIALTNLEAIVPCMPGAELNQAETDGSYTGKVTTRLGPVALTFNGTAQFTELNETAYRASLRTRGNDTKGRGAVDATLTLLLKEQESAQVTEVLIQTTLTLSGSIAQYGRGTGMIKDIADRWMTDFSECLVRSLEKNTNTNQATEPDIGATTASPIPVLGIIFRGLWQRILRILRLAD
ncbi:MAG: SRPBCC family protein [Arenicellales bacterium]|nr:SRPBCC family protein [Arenicellales bacterium]